MKIEIESATRPDGATVNNYYYDNRTQVVVVNQPERRVTTSEYDALARSSDKMSKLLLAQTEIQREDTKKIVSLLLENKQLRDEVRRLRAMLPPTEEKGNTVIR